MKLIVEKLATDNEDMISIDLDALTSLVWYAIWKPSIQPILISVFDEILESTDISTFVDGKAGFIKILYRFDTRFLVI